MVRILGIGPLGSKPLRLEAQAPAPPTLVVDASGASLEVRGLRGDGPARILVTGRLKGRGRASLRVEEDPDLGLVARLALSGAKALVETPLRALVARVSATSITLKSMAPLRYVSLDLSAAAVRLATPLSVGGGLLAVMDASALKASLEDLEPGEYWVELRMSSSAARITTPEQASYSVEAGGSRTLSLRVDPAKASRTSNVIVRVKVGGSASSVRLL